jgi:hypothetical protein
VPVGSAALAGSLCVSSATKQVAIAVPRLDITRLLGVVAQRLAQLLNAGGQRIVADDGPLQTAAINSCLVTGWPARSSSSPSTPAACASASARACRPTTGRGRGLVAIAIEAEVLTAHPQQSRRNPGIRPGLKGRAFVAFWHNTGAHTSRAWTSFWRLLAMLKRLSIFVYGVLSYAVFFATYLYAIGFVGNLWVPKSMDSVRQTPFLTALLIDLGLLGCSPFSTA